MKNMKESANSIRPAEEKDRRTIVDLMENALAPYYDGDHSAHAGRIIDAHVKGGRDGVGHFSFEQRMFVAEKSGEIIGMVHVVGKRQGTYKISPLIVAPSCRGHSGIGSALLQFAEDYARQMEARQMYCTVAEQNHSALQFFRRKGYVVAGSSDSHYKANIKELMLYKLLASNLVQEKFDKTNISVVPFEECFRDQASALILETLPKFFGGINEAWLDGLYEGYHRRDSGDINLKFKLIYLAIDRDHRVLGIAGATPKKGQPIKVMPLVSRTLQAFEALLTDIPFLLKPYGHKLYIHIVPTVEQTISLQRMGWKLDAAMPAAYHDEYVTQQWSYTIGGDLMRQMRVKSRYFNLIKAGEKTLEVRVGYDNIRTIQPGERIILSTHSDEMTIRVNGVRTYASFTDMIKVENAQLIAPGLDRDAVLALLKEIYPPDKEKLGVIVLDIVTESSE